MKTSDNSISGLLQRVCQLGTNESSAAHVDHWIRCCDDLDGEISKAMDMVNLTCAEGFGACRGNATNTSPHRPWIEYYNNETLCLVQVLRVVLLEPCL